MRRPLALSIAAHALIGGALAMLFFLPARNTALPVEIEVITYPTLVPKPLELSPPKTKPIDKPKDRPSETEHKVFGISRTSLVDETPGEGTAVKAGNTVAKAPDAEHLNKDDSEQLPIPTDEYLVNSMPSLAQEVRIPYPPEAKQKGIEGPVIMDLLIDEAGRVRQASLISGPGAGLNEAALAAIRGFQFHPAKVSDKAVAVKIRYTYRFVLEKS